MNSDKIKIFNDKIKLMYNYQVVVNIPHVEMFTTGVPGAIFKINRYGKFENDDMGYCDQIIINLKYLTAKYHYRIACIREIPVKCFDLFPLCMEAVCYNEEVKRIYSLAVKFDRLSELKSLLADLILENSHARHLSIKSDRNCYKSWSDKLYKFEKSLYPVKRSLKNLWGLLL
jgi:hypothetical protein